jgi:hypothetical protein
MRRWANLWSCLPWDRNKIFSARMSGHRAGKGDVFPVWDILPFPKSLTNAQIHRRGIPDPADPAMTR